MSFPPKPYVTQFVYKEKLTDDNYTFHFKKPKDFQFSPGQYNRWTLDLENPDDRGSSRYFTIASSPLDGDLRVTTRIIQSSFKSRLASLTEGDNINIFGPLGNFVLDEEGLMPKVFLAGGIGITPYYSMITYAYQKKLQNDLILLASFSNKSEVIFHDELRKISNQTPNIKIIYTLTKEKGEGFESGRINGEMIKKYVSPEESTFYIVGPPVMVSSMEETIKDMGVSEDRIRIENFTGY